MTEKIVIVGNLAKDIINGEEQYGGSAANIAIGLRHLGIDVGILSVFGKDEFSKRYRIFLEDAGVDTSLIQRRLDILPVCEVFDKSNTNMSRRWSDNGCKAAMEQLSVRPNQLKDSLVHMVCCPPTLPRKFLGARVNISYEPGPMLVFSPDYFDPKVANESLLIFLNKEELEIVAKLNQGVRRDGFDFLNPRALIITLGENGSRLITRNANNFVSLDLPPVDVPVSKIIDFTGAGDNYKAGFLAGFVRGKSLIECVQIGSEMGAACIKYQGGLLPKTEAMQIKSKYLN